MIWTRILAETAKQLLIKRHVENVAPMSERFHGNEMVEVRSECIDTCSYDVDTKDMKLKFQKGKKEYTYPDVPSTMFFQFLSAPSKGKAYWSLFRNWDK